MSLIKISKSTSGPGKFLAKSSNIVYNAESSDYFSAAGVTDLTVRSEINQFIVALRDMKVYDRTACWLLRSSQNKGSGNIVYSFGGLAVNLEGINGGGAWLSDGTNIQPGVCGFPKRWRGIIFDRLSADGVSKVANASNPLIQNNTMFWCGALENEREFIVTPGEDDYSFRYNIEIEGAGYAARNGLYTAVAPVGYDHNYLDEISKFAGEGYIYKSGNTLTIFDGGPSYTPIYISYDNGTTWENEGTLSNEEVNPPPISNDGWFNNYEIEDVVPNAVPISNVFSIGQPGAGTHILTNITDNTVTFSVPRTINGSSSRSSVSFNAGNGILPYIKTFNFIGLFMGATSNSNILNNSEVSTETNLGTRTFNGCCNVSSPENTEINVGNVPGWDCVDEQESEIARLTSFAMSTNLENANQLKEIYSLYKSTLGKNLGLP